MIISHNIFAINAQRQFNINTKNKAINNEKLSSGYRINRSADDAAGLSISEKMRNQIRGLNQGLKNVEDGIGYIKTSEGALNEVHLILERMEELSVQSANDVNTAEDRKSIDNEIQQLKEEMNRIFDRTAFNGKKIWEPEMVKIENNNESIIKDGIVLETFLSYIEVNNNNITMIPDGNGITVNANEQGLFFSWKGIDGNDYSSDIFEWNDGLYGNYTLEGRNCINYDVLNFNPQFKFQINEGVSLTEVTDYIDGQKLTRIGDGCGQKLNAIDSNGQIISDLYINERKTPDILVLYNAHEDFNDPNDETIQFAGISSDPIVTGDNNKNWEYKYYIEGIGNVYAIPKTVSFYETRHENGKTITEQKHTIRDAFSPNTIKELNDWRKDNCPESGGYILIDYDTTDNIFNYSIKYSIQKNDDEFYDDLLELMSKTEKISIKTGTNNHFAFREFADTYKIYINTDQQYIMNGQKEFYIQHGANAGEDMLISYDCLSNDYLGLTNTNVLTREDSSQAINDIQEAVKKVSAQRSQFGAYQNRLEYVAANNANYSENLQNAESNLRDTNMAKEMLEYSKNSILEQAAQSMISQANQQNQGMLQLLQ